RRRGTNALEFSSGRPPPREDEGAREASARAKASARAARLPSRPSSGTSINRVANGPRTADLIVVGAGIVGLAVAWRGRERGLDVVLLERERTGQGASRVAAGMLAPVAEVEFGEGGRRLLALGLRSAMMWPRFASELERASGEAVGLGSEGTLFV